MRNRLDFARSTKSPGALHGRLRKDVAQYGIDAFSLEVLEVLDAKPEATVTPYSAELLERLGERKVKTLDDLAIRSVRLTDGDAAAIAALKKAWNEEYWIGGSPHSRDVIPAEVSVSAGQAKQRLRSMARTEKTFLGERGGLPVGFICIRFSPQLDEDVPYAEVTQLYVLPAHRRHGVAGSLMAHVGDLAAKRGCTSIHLVTLVSNTGASAFYRRMGYEPLSTGFERFLPNHLLSPKTD